MFPTRVPKYALIAVVVTAALVGCSDNALTNAITPPPQFQCDAGNGGITLPAGFCAVVVADLLNGANPAAARHMALTPSGDLFVAINNPNNSNPAFGIIGLRDVDGDGHAEMQSPFSAGLGGSGIAWGSGSLYFGANDQVVRYALPDGQLAPAGAAQVVVSGLPSAGDHVSKTLVLANPQTLYVNIGSATNSCQVLNRQLQSPGIAPCPELPGRAGVWTFDPAGTGQTQASGHHYATGYRNLVALAVNPTNNVLYGVQQGRDMLADNWPQFFTDAQAAVLPDEEFVRITDGSNNGWPYCFYDGQVSHKKLLAPEYGGDGTTTSGGGIDCATFNQPLATFGAHWSPDGMHFYSGTQFPAKYRGGLFVVFHGGFDRAPLPNEGYKVMFVPMGADGNPSAAAEVFADGFAGTTVGLPASAVHRPVGVAEGPDGSLYISDDKGGRIWRIVYRP
ncbi:MAG: PQQ-dependent sugar dehydrogenase [bacterium]